MINEICEPDSSPNLDIYFFMSVVPVNALDAIPLIRVLRVTYDIVELRVFAPKLLDQPVGIIRAKLHNHQVMSEHIVG